MERGKDEGKKRKWKKQEIKTWIRNDRKIGKERNGNKFTERRWEENIQEWRGKKYERESGKKEKKEG